MKDLSSLQSAGYSVINGDEQALASIDTCTVMVLGGARGGTSAIAGALAKMGLFLGSTAGDPVYEDLRLALAIEKNKSDDVDAIIAEYNEQHPTWGFKRPGFIRHAANYHPHLRQPRYIAVFRDTFAIAQRAVISGNADLLDAMDKAAQDLGDIIDFLRVTGAPAMLVSYEKLLQQPQDIVPALASFSGLDVSEVQLQVAADFISPSPAAYVEASRLNRTRGRLDIVEPTRILGWAQYMSQERPPIVSLLINGVETRSVQANLFRQDLLDMHVSADGQCAFEIQLDRVLHDGDEVRVKVNDDLFDLMNSPFTYRAPASTLTRCLRRLFNWIGK